MSDQKLRKKLVRLAYQKPEFRQDIISVLKEGGGRTAGGRPTGLVRPDLHRALVKSGLAKDVQSAVSSIERFWNLMMQEAGVPRNMWDSADAEEAIVSTFRGRDRETLKALERFTQAAVELSYYNK